MKRIVLRGFAGLFLLALQFGFTGPGFAQANSFQFWVKSLDGKTYTINANSGTTLADLKGILNRQGGYPEQRMLVIYLAIELKDGQRTLVSYGVKSEAVVHLVMRRK